MREAPAADTGWRASPDIWLEAAYGALLEGGVEGVRIQSLAERLKISRTSFYWFFKDRAAILEALVARWRETNTGHLVGQTERYAETIVEAMLNVFDCWLQPALFDPQFEFAIRSWALQSPPILHEVREADRLRLEALDRMFQRFGFDPGEADVRARTTYLVQIGYISMQTAEDLAVRLDRIPNYVRIFTGHAPGERDMERFLSRHRAST